MKLNGIWPIVSDVGSITRFKNRNQGKYFFLNKNYVEIVTPFDYTRHAIGVFNSDVQLLFGGFFKFSIHLSN